MKRLKLLEEEKARLKGDSGAAEVLIMEWPAPSSRVGDKLPGQPGEREWDTYRSQS
jgi:hypothetical protein